ncbi:MAG TPA: formate--tetrahydrofolate ligase [Solirubrobacteraceae bacterium]|nr:formate--tetrahydrofolate ligase [Solirubrobacteraceae bacterium]
MSDRLPVHAPAVVPIADVAARAGLRPEEIVPWGRAKAKVDAARVLDPPAGAPRGRLVCVTAVTPTLAGEGKTTTAIGLADGLATIGARPVLCLREPSLGPVFGRKGGGAGGGRAQLVPMEDVNLHFTGDNHAVAAANNLLASMLDASLIHGNPLGVDPATITWRRALDMNDRVLRRIEVGLDPGDGAFPRETGFDIAAASEVMAVLSVAEDLVDLRRRLGAIVVARDRKGRPVTAEALRAAGSMTVLLRDALDPNLVQTREGTPCLVHAGPFANIAHGNNSVIADRVALALGDHVVTEAGFAADLGFEKFADIVCPSAGLAPSAAVVVAGVETLRHHGGGDLEAGAANLRRHIGIVGAFGVPCIVAVNRRVSDADADLQRACALALGGGARAAVVCDAFERGGEGAAELARAVADACAQPSDFRPLYPDGLGLAEKLEVIARRVYGAGAVELTPAAARRIAELEAEGLGALPVCVAKTPLSLSADPALIGAPEGFTLPVGDVRAYAGAGWVVAICGDVQLMPGLPDGPVAERIDIDSQGRAVGLF